MKKKVLIISVFFEPQNVVGAIRPSKLAKYLSRKGYDVTVFTSYQTLTDESFKPERFSIIYDVDNFKANDNLNRQEKVSNYSSKLKFIPAKLRKELTLLYRTYLNYKDSKLFCQRFIDALRNNRIDIRNYDCVFSTFGPIGSILAGIKAKKQYPNIKWINDFRDPMITIMTPHLLRPIYSYLQKRSVRICDYVTTVSEGYKQRILSYPDISKALVITNGFDMDDKPKDYSTTRSYSFEMSYVGALYEGKRDIGPLFKVLKRLSDEGILPLNKMVFHYAGRDIVFLREQANRYGMEEIICDHGFLSRDVCLQLQASSTFLVLSTWNEKGEEGVFPGKFIEYMLINKPIISIVDGDLPDSEVSMTIKQYNLGISYESANPSTEEGLYQWLKVQAVQFQKGLPPVFEPDIDGIRSMFDWENIVERFCELIDG